MKNNIRQYSFKVEELFDGSYEWTVYKGKRRKRFGRALDIKVASDRAIMAIKELTGKPLNSESCKKCKNKFCGKEIICKYYLEEEE